MNNANVQYNKVRAAREKYEEKKRNKNYQQSKENTWGYRRPLDTSSRNTRVGLWKTTPNTIRVF